jgi:hypothetical protein
VATLGEVFDLVNKSGNLSVRINTEVNTEAKTNPEHPQLTLAPKAFLARVVEIFHDSRMEVQVMLPSLD